MFNFFQILRAKAVARNYLKVSLEVLQKMQYPVCFFAVLAGVRLHFPNNMAVQALYCHYKTNMLKLTSNAQVELLTSIAEQHITVGENEIIVEFPPVGKQCRLFLIDFYRKFNSHWVSIGHSVGSQDEVVLASGKLVIDISEELFKERTEFVTKLIFGQGKAFEEAIEYHIPKIIASIEREGIAIDNMIEVKKETRISMARRSGPIVYEKKGLLSRVLDSLWPSSQTPTQ